MFGYPYRIISDRDTAFVSNLFKEYCEAEGIQHHTIATGVPRGKGQVERIHKIVIPMLPKLCYENPCSCYKHIDVVQQTISKTPPRSTQVLPLRLLTGVEMKLKRISELHRL